VGIMVAIQLPAFFSDYTIYIDVVAIQPEYQHRGLGTKMMNSFFESVSGKSATSLNTYKNSEPYKFYQQFRFKDDEIVHMEREYIDVNELIKRLENEVANLREKNSTQPSE
uniref:GNAT family N-acetyltransferase n=1 Tax=Ruminococcus bicirculans (ex Wegman et al. 2014) TaxID=1160721 RepID=UPI00307F55E3